MRHYLMSIVCFFAVTFFNKCGSSDRTYNNVEQIAIRLANNFDSNSINLFKEYSYGRRGDYDFWSKLSADTISYTCCYKMNQDTIELTVFSSQNFIKDFASTFKFDTTIYNEYKFFRIQDSIVRLLRVDNHGQEHFSDTLVLSNQLFPSKDPFSKFAELNTLKDKFGFIGTFYRNDIGEFMVFWITPQYKLTYLPDSTKMNPKSKRYWLDDFANGKKIKEYWSLQKVYE